MADERAYSPTRDDSNEEQVDISKILSDVKEFTEGSESTNKAEMADNQHLIETLTKINNLAGGDLGKKDVRNVFEFFGKNFKTKLKSSLTVEQAQDLKNEIEYLINNTSFDDKELEQQMNSLYTLLCTFVEPEHGNEKDEEAIISADLASDLGTDDNSKLNADLPNNSNPDPTPTSNINTSPEPTININTDGKVEDVKQDIKATQEELVSDINDTPNNVNNQESATPLEKNENLKGNNLKNAGPETSKSTIQDKNEQPVKKIKVEDEKKTTNKKDSTDKKEKRIPEKIKIDERANQEYLSEYISDKEFPGKNIIQDMIIEKDAIKKKEKLKLLQLQLIPYYDGQIDGLINSETLTAIEKYVTKNPNKKGETIIKSDNPHVIRCEFNGKIIDNVDGLNTVIKKIGDKELGHAYFLDYPDFEYTIENNTTITATVNDFNYFYDIATNTLQKQKRDDPLQDVTNEEILQKHLNTIATIINK